MDELRKSLTAVAAALQALGGNTKELAGDVRVTTERVEDLAGDLKRMTSRVTLMDENITTLKGTFASIEVHLVKLFESDAERRAEQEALKAQWQELARRVEALEKKAG